MQGEVPRDADAIIPHPAMEAAPAGRLRDLVCVAICTCDRHEPLRYALDSLLVQSVGTDFQVILVDNGLDPADGIAAAFRGRLDIVYERVAEPGLTAVRNRSLVLACRSGARFLACLDDDETADPEWLRAHLDAVERSDADIQTGHVEPLFLADPPAWIVEGGFFVEDGGVPTTANLLLRLSCLPPDQADWFSPAYASSGGEDYEFITRLVSRGARYATAAEARVLDRVPSHRMTLRFLLRRGLRDGVYFGVWAGETYRNPLRRAWACLCKAAGKLGYAVNHLFWSPLAPWRARRAGVDLASVAGILVALAGVRIRFYGHATSPSRRA